MSKFVFCWTLFCLCLLYWQLHDDSTIALVAFVTVFAMLSIPVWIFYYLQKQAPVDKEKSITEPSVEQQWGQLIDQFKDSMQDYSQSLKILQSLRKKIHNNPEFCSSSVRFGLIPNCIQCISSSTPDDPRVPAAADVINEILNCPSAKVLVCSDAEAVRSLVDQYLHCCDEFLKISFLKENPTQQSSKYLYKLVMTLGLFAADQEAVQTRLGDRGAIPLVLQYLGRKGVTASMATWCMWTLIVSTFDSTFSPS